MNRFLVISLLCLVAGISSCGPKGPPGTWSPIDTGKPNDTFFELNFLAPETGWVTGWDSKGPKETDGWDVLQTKDGGKTWNALPNQAEQRIKLVYFVSSKPNVGWALNLDQDILNTTDGGQTWTVQRKAEKAKIKYNYNNPEAPTELPEPIARFRFFNEKVGWAWGGGKKESSFEQEGVFLRTEDGGQSWQKVDYQFADELKALFFLDPNNGWASDRKAGLYKSIDGGRVWQKQPDDLRRPSINSIFFIDSSRGWIAGADGYVGRTEDGGKNWQKRRTGTAYLNDLFFVSGKVGWAAGDGGTILYTEDGFQSWEKQDSGTEGSIKQLQFLNNKQGWAAGNNGLLLRYEGRR